MLAGLTAAMPLTSAGQSITAGTIVIVAQAKDYIIIAADSRVGASNGTSVTSIDDSYCKIAPLGGDTIFAAAGVVTDPARSWAADTEMDKVLPATPQNERMSSADGASALGRWAAAMIQKLFRVPRDQLIVYTQSNGGVAAAAMLAGLGKDGRTWVQVSKIVSDGAGNLSHQESETAPPSSATEYFGLGQSAIAVEFDHGETARAVAERAEWRKTDLDGIAFDRFKARRLAELTIEYIPDKSDVGGPIDEMELDAHGQHWIQVKPHCQQ